METYHVDWLGFNMVDDNGMYADAPSACIQCQEPTHRIDINFEAPVHAGKCIESLWQEYFDATTERGPVVDWNSN